MNLAFSCLVPMRIFRGCLLIILGFTFSTCTDDSELAQDTLPVLEPLDDAVRLQTIQVNDDTGNLLTTYQINYNDLNLIDRVDVSGNMTVAYSMDYAANNRLVNMQRITSGEQTDYTFSYDENMIDVSIAFPDGSRQLTRLSLDLQNRIDGVVIFNQSNAGNLTQQQEQIFNYTENFNVNSIVQLGPSGAVESVIDLSYQFNINPFRDMNDLIRFVVFKDFIPYTRYLPHRIIITDRLNGGSMIIQTIDYNYTLQENNFPSSREVIMTDANGVVTTSQTFVYLP